jgi:hypothetical protein
MYQKLHQKLKLSRNQHTIHRLPRHHTSYGALLICVLITGFILLGSTKITQSTSAVLGDQVTLSGVLQNPPPTEKPVITAPQNGAITSSEITTVRGTCGQYVTVVQMFRSGIFAGSTFCENNAFEITVHLDAGKNVLVAKAADSFGQFAPESDPVSVTYASAAGSSPTSPGAASLVASSDKPYLGSASGKPLELSLVLHGGNPPYAVNIDWGDGQEELISQPAPGILKLSHTYTSGGLYTIRVKVVDNLKNVTSLEFAAIIQGPAATPATGSTKSDKPEAIPYVKPSLAIIWPLYLFLLAIVLAFWLGEKYELHKLRRSH